jgi:agmatinase
MKIRSDELYMETKSPEEAELLIQKLPCDMGIHRNPRKGTLNAPDKILDGLDFEKTVMIDEVFPDEFDLQETQRRIELNTEDLAEYSKPILSIGGDHSVSFPVIKMLKQKNPDLQLVWLDSHLDLKKKIDGHVSHDVVVRQLLNCGFLEDEIWFIGITRVDQDEEEFLEDRDLKVFRAEEIDEFLREFSSDDSVYLSVDIDVLKQELAPGTGYPDGSLELEDVEKVIEKVQPDYGDLVEVAPPFDKENKTLDNGGQIIKKLDSALR